MCKYTKLRGNIICKESIRQLIQENYNHQIHHNVLDITAYSE